MEVQNMIRRRGRPEREERALARPRDLWWSRDFLNEMDRWFEDFRSGLEDFLWTPRIWRPTEYLAEIRRPATDVLDTGKEIVVTAELPGIDKEDIDISVEEDCVEIKAERKLEKEEKEEGYHYRERGYKSFYRKMGLPASVIPDKAEAQLNNGVLEIKLPKAEPTEETKRHKIKVK